MSLLRELTVVIFIFAYYSKATFLSDALKEVGEDRDYVTSSSSEVEEDVLNTSVIIASERNPIGYSCCMYFTGLSKVGGFRQKFSAYLVSISQLLCLAFLHRRHFLIKTSLDVAAYFDNSATYFKTF